MDILSLVPSDQFQFSFARFAVTDTKLVDLISDRNVSVPDFCEKNHMKPAESIAELKRALDPNMNFTNLATCTVVRLERLDGSGLGKLYMIDIKEAFFGLDFEQLELDDHAPQTLAKSMAKLEMLGGRAHSFLSFSIDVEPSSIDDRQIQSFLEFCATVRKVRNTIYPLSIDANVKLLSDTNAELAQQVQDQLATIKDKSLGLEQLTQQSQDKEALLAEKAATIARLEAQLLALNSAAEEKEQLWLAKQTQLEHSLDEITTEKESHFKICMHERQEATEARLAQMTLLLEGTKRESQVEKQLLKLQVSEMALRVAECTDEVRSQQARTALAEFERDEVRSNFDFYDTLHHNDVSAILRAKAEVHVLQEEKKTLECKLVEKEGKISEMALKMDSLKDECREFGRQVVDLQQKALEKSSVLEQASKDEGSLLQKFSELSHENSDLKTSLQTATARAVSLEAQIQDLATERAGMATLEALVKSKENEVSALSDRLKNAEQECKGLRDENLRLNGLCLTHQKEAQEAKERLDQTLGLLETQLAKTQPDGASKEDELYKEKLEEARRAQKELMDRMILRETLWAQERRDLLDTMKTTEKTAKKPKKTKSTAKKSSDAAVPEDEPSPKQSVESTRETNKTKKPSRKTKAAAPSSDVEDKAVPAAIPPEQPAAPAVVQKESQPRFKLGKSKESKENTDPKARTGILAKQGFLSQASATIGVDNPKGPLSGIRSFWKRPKATDGADSESPSQDSQTSGHEPDILPKIPKQYVDKRRMELLFPNSTQQ
ncbi:hypothetical protein HDV03_000090 [Kappamyces sp. JEL0829]|nr:hypothetical protein HDV03_000090 [Kappamyces sp. JEL0829]